MATTAIDAKTNIQKQIEELKKRLEALDQEAVDELKLKLSDARKVVTHLEMELEVLTGKTASLAVKVRRERRPSITDDALKDQLLKVMANFGAEGMNAKQLAEKLHQDPLRIRKFIKDNPKTLKRTGGGPGTKFFLP
jgi:FtsZ-binding cell division protein ZapB